MDNIKKSIKIVCMGIILGLIVYGNVSQVYASTDMLTYLNDNRNAQDYTDSNWAKYVSNYLVKTENGYMRVHMNTRSHVYVEYFDESYRFISQAVIDFELPIVGGFFAGKDSYYLVFGNENKSESDSVEVIRVVKYDKNWNRLTSASVYGANTAVPFDAGSLRMAETNGQLYVRTCHEMYKADDGINHQANMTIIINENDMTVADLESDFWDYSQNNQYFMSYASHSFNQFILSDRFGDVVFLDHGDAFPRAALIAKEGREKWGRGQKQEIVSYGGDIGDNWTNSTVGGLEYAGNNYLTVGTVGVNWDYDDYNDEYVNDENYVYLSVNERDLREETRLISLTKTSKKKRYSTPQLVKLTENKLMVLWSEKVYDAKEKKFILDGKVHYVYVDENGNLLGDIKQAKGYLSDCQPIAVNGRVVWTTADNESLKFNVIDENGMYSGKKVSFPKEMIKYPIKMSDCHLVALQIGKIRSLSDDEFMDEYAKLFRLYGKDLNDVLQFDVDYRFFYTTYLGNSADIFYLRSLGIKGVGEQCYGTNVFYSDYKEWPSVYIHEQPQNVSVKRISSGIRIKWEKEPYALGYYVYRKYGDGSYEKIATIPDVSKNSYVDPVARKNKPYSYYIKTYTTNGKKLITTKRSKVKKIN